MTLVTDKVQIKETFTCYLDSSAAPSRYQHKSDKVYPGYPTEYDVPTRLARSTTANLPATQLYKFEWFLSLVLTADGGIPP